MLVVALAAVDLSASSVMLKPRLVPGRGGGGILSFSSAMERFESELCGRGFVGEDTLRLTGDGCLGGASSLFAGDPAKGRVLPRDAAVGCAKEKERLRANEPPGVLNCVVIVDVDAVLEPAGEG